MSTHTTKFKALIYRLGSEPKRSVKRFFSGLGLFCIALGFIAAGYYWYALLQIPGLILLILAIALAMWGYLGIFANRFSQVLSATDVQDKE